MSDLKIETCDVNNIKQIINGINDYNLSIISAVSAHWTPLEFVIKDKDGKEIAGILAGIGYWNGLEIKILWVDENFRNNGLATKLLNYVETTAKEKGATISMLDTFDFQAPGFYLKNGYDQIGEINDFPKGRKRIYFSKKL